MQIVQKVAFFDPGGHVRSDKTTWSFQISLRHLACNEMNWRVESCVGNTLNSYWEGIRFESQLGHCLSCMSFSMVFLSFPRQMRRVLVS
jgi:hypothetical protein